MEKFDMRRSVVFALFVVFAFVRCGDDEVCSDGQHRIVIGEQLVCPGQGDGSSADGFVFVDGKSPDTGQKLDIGYSGACVGKTDYDGCDTDGNACTVEYCDPTTFACEYKDTVACDDKGCEQGKCNPDTGECEYTPVPVGTDCKQSCFTNGFVCDGAGQCVPGDYVCAAGATSCEIVPVTPVKISCAGTPTNDGCVDHFECNPDDGLCTLPIYKPNDFGCDLDNDPCTLDKCTALAENPDIRVCTSTGELDTCESQNKDNPCWTYTCAGKAGCKQTSFIGGVSCNDGNACTVNDTCVDGGNGFGQKSCKGTPLDTSDGDPCTSDACVDGEVVHSPLTGTACEDNFICTKTQCVEGKCMVIGQITCDDGNVCTYDLCDPQSGCVFVPNNEPCDDGSVCTKNDTCNQQICKGNPVICEDENPCNGVQTCVESQGCVLTESPPNCDDDNVCTTDVCNPQFKTSELDELTDACGHAFNIAPCDDGSACTSGDVCGAGTCKGKDLKCDDGDLCNGTHGCDKDEGCVELTGIVNCNDANPCTDDFCDPFSGCVFVPNNQPCDDGSACSKDDACKSGQCKGIEIKCDNGNACDGVESCDKDKGCQSGKALVCDDGDKCSGEESCDPIAGCKSGTPLVCDDDTVCNGIFTCKAATGCVQIQPAPNCDDKNPCTDDVCDAKLGCLHNNNTAPCTDGSKCTIGDTCKNGVCTPVNSIVCFDNNVCTTDSCTAATGECKFTPAPNASCNDGDECTLVDFCTAAGTCTGSGEKKCASDNDPCTADVCISFYGCDYPKLTCEDSEECTLDYCGSGPGGGGCFHVNQDNGKPCGPNKDKVCQAGKCVTN